MEGSWGKRKSRAQGLGQGSLHRGLKPVEGKQLPGFPLLPGAALVVITHNSCFLRAPAMLGMPLIMPATLCEVPIVIPIL